MANSLAQSAQDSIAIAVQAGEIPYVESNPGTGKSSVMEAIGRVLNYRFHSEIGSIAEASDVKGYPFVSEAKQGVDFTPPAWMIESLSDIEKGFAGTLAFMDELPNSPLPVMASYLTLFTAHRAGNFQLPKTVRFAAAGNPLEQSPNGSVLPAPLANRMVHLPFPADTALWANGLLAGFPAPEVPRVPANWQDYLVQERSMVAGFSRHRPALMNAMPKHENEQAKAWPSFRTWTMAANLLAACEAAGASKDVRMLLVTGCVGAAGGEYLNWREHLDLPNPEDLLKKPQSLKLPTRGDLQFAILGSVAGAVISNMTPGRYKSGWLVMVEAAKAAPDVAASAIMPMAKARKPGCVVPKEAAVFYPLLQAAGLTQELAAK